MSTTFVNLANTSYPDTLDVALPFDPATRGAWTTNRDGDDTIYAMDVNIAHDAILAIEGILGTVPQGTFNSVALRLAKLETDSTTAITGNKTHIHNGDIGQPSLINLANHTTGSLPANKILLLGAGALSAKNIYIEPTAQNPTTINTALANKLDVTTGGVITGNLSATKLISTATSGSPIEVTSNALVSNLNAQYINGKSDTDFLSSNGGTLSGDLLLTDNNTKIGKGTNNGLAVTVNGYTMNIYNVSNTSQAIETSAPKFVFNKDLYINTNKVLHTGAMGTGSGIDADKLDSIEGSQFMRKDIAQTAAATLTLGTGALLKKTSAAGVTTTIIDDNGAVWSAVYNDIAEVRKSLLNYGGGCVVTEGDHGAVIKCEKRRDKNAMIVSDTFGFCMGKDEKYQASVPVAIAGRVLASTDFSPEYFKVGDMVCSSKRAGRVSKMKWWEKIFFPHSCIGIVSEVPKYDTWGSSNVDVKNRVWIKVK
jgi:hypothetical protein